MTDSHMDKLIERVFGLMVFLIMLLGGATVALIVLAAGCNAIGAASGRSHAQALTAARAWSAEMGVSPNRVTCANSDTDGDGYVSCNVSIEKSDKSIEIIPIECAGAFTLNNGCRTARILSPQR